LNLRGAAFFLVNVDEEGVVDPTFNLPLSYLVRNAGVGRDLGQGPVRVASRAQCSVPWQAVNLWEPDNEDVLEQIQKCLFRNKLKLKSSTDYRDEDFFTPLAESFELVDNSILGPSDAFDEQCFDDQIEASEGDVKTWDIRSPDEDQPEQPKQPELPEQFEQSKPESLPSLSAQAPEVAANVECGAKLNEVFGDAGKLSLQDLIRLHTQQLDQARTKYRDDVETQQTAYLSQLRSCREEMHDLKVALRQEQGRNRRLQQMLRGDIGSM
jgi:hypothetical protein